MSAQAIKAIVSLHQICRQCGEHSLEADKAREVLEVVLGGLSDEDEELMSQFVIKNGIAENDIFKAAIAFIDDPSAKNLTILSSTVSKLHELENQ